MGVVVTFTWRYRIIPRIPSNPEILRYVAVCTELHTLRYVAVCTELHILRYVAVCTELHIQSETYYLLILNGVLIGADITCINQCQRFLSIKP